MNCKPGDLAVIVNARRAETKGNIGRFVEVIEPYTGQVVEGCNYGPQEGLEWVVKSAGAPLVSATFSGRKIFVQWHVCADAVLRPIRDQPGNEQFVVESRKSLPRKKPVTGPVTINERGAIA